MPEYQWDAQDYAKNSSQQQLWARELMRKFGLRGDEAVLDVGCGDGKVTAELAAGLPRGTVVGVDVSPAMVELAQKRFPPADYPNLHFQREDAAALPFHEEFSAVFSNAVLHWLVDHRPAMRGIAAALKPGGKILLQMGGRGNNAEMMALLGRMTRSERWAGYFEGFAVPYGFYGPEEYAVWLAEAGLRAIRLELIPKDMVHPGREGLAGWVRTTKIPYTQRLPEELRPVFINEVLDAYLAEMPLDAQGNAHISMVRLEVEAVKP